MFWKELFALNQVIILSIYGQVFFVLGLAIFMQSRRRSRLKLARDLRWLALFGILHGLHEWGLVFIPIQADYLPSAVIVVLQMAQVWLLAVSFVALLIFGLVLLEPLSQSMRWFAFFLLSGWLALVLLVYLFIPDSSERIRQIATGSRYLIGLPGGMLSALGLYRQAQSRLMVAENARYGRMLHWAAWFLFAYTLSAGLIVAPASFFPANILNRAAFLEWSGIPVELLRSIFGLLLTISIIRALELFEVEVEQLIETMEVEAIRATERERIGQEIHDGVIQGAYSVGLILDSMAKHIDNPLAGQRLTQAQQVLEQVILGLRRYMTSLRTRPPEGCLAEELAALTAEPRFRSLVNIRLEIADAPRLDATHTGHILGLVQEALSNVVRHAQASQVIVHLQERRDVMELTVQDDGQGFASQRVAAGYGLLTMRNHAQLLGGQLTIDSAPGKGATVKVVWPRSDSGNRPDVQGDSRERVADSRNRE
ncbi:MAG: sensor histidine kinase [Chloroflexi bacterium]|nr:sensor histidine kinase [Chloroflexota bacterium]